MGRHDVEIQRCVDHLTTNAAHYFSVVKERRQEGVLWAVFTSPQPGRVNVKRASFLPLTTVLSTNAPSLVQMFNECNHTTSFVAWFTLEGNDGDPIASKVMTIDASVVERAQREDARREKIAAAQRAEAAAVTTPPGSLSPGAAGSPTAAIDGLKKEMMTFEAEAEAKARAAAAAPVRRSGHGSPGRATTPKGGRHTGFAEGSGPVAAKDASALQAQYHQLLRVSVRVADSVSDLARQLEELSERVRRVESLQASTPPPASTDIVITLMQRIDALEARNAQLTSRVAAFDDIQKQFFEQIEQLRRGNNAAASLADAARREADDEEIRKPISYREAVERKQRQRETAAADAVRLARGSDSFFSSIPFVAEGGGGGGALRAGVRTPSNLSGTASRDRSPVRALDSLSATAEPLPATRGGVSPTRAKQPQPVVGMATIIAAPSPKNATPRAVSPSTRLPDAAEDSLTGMIAKMERKLSRLGPRRT